MKTAVDGDHVAGHVGAGGAGQADRQRRHLLRATPAAHGNRRAVRLQCLRVIGDVTGHAARKASGSDHIDIDVLADQFLRQHPRQLMQRGLARPVGIGLFAHGADARHRADVDHPRRVLRAGRAAQQRQQLLDAGKHRGDIELHDLFPAGHRIAFQRCAPTGAGVVHQDIQPRAESAERLRQAPGTGFAGKVGGDRLAVAVGREACGGVGAGLCVTCADEDAGAGFEKTLGDHLADAAAAAGDQGDATGETEIGMHGNDSGLGRGDQPTIRLAAGAALSRYGMTWHPWLSGYRGDATDTGRRSG